jgi:hypothetical protein
MTYDQIEKLYEDMVNEVKQIELNAQKLSWFMRGGVSYTDILNMSSREVSNLHDIVKENLDVTKKSKLPFF